MSWIWVGILIGIGLILAPLVLMIAVTVGLFAIVLLGLPAISAGIGYLIAIQAGTDPLQGILVGGGIGFAVTVVGLSVYGFSGDIGRNKER